MTCKRSFLFMLGLLTGITASTQSESVMRNQFDVSPFKLEINPLTVNQIAAPLFLFGVDYQRVYPTLNWISGFAYGHNIINDGPSLNGSCGDCMGGQGLLNEYLLSTGIQYRFFGKKITKIKLFIESGLYYSNTQYSADLYGGITGFGHQHVDKGFQAIGLLSSAGMIYFPMNRVSISAMSSFRLEQEWGYYSQQWGTSGFYRKYSGFTFGALSLFQLRLGFLF